MHVVGNDDAEFIASEDELMTALLVTTKEAARLVGVGENTLKQLAAATPDHPKPIRLVSDHPLRRQYRWPVEALRAYYNATSTLTVEPHQTKPIAKKRSAKKASRGPFKK